MFLERCKIAIFITIIATELTRANTGTGRLIFTPHSKMLPCVNVAVRIFYALWLATLTNDCESPFKIVGESGAHLIQEKRQLYIPDEVTWHGSTPRVWRFLRHNPLNVQHFPFGLHNGKSRLGREVVAEPHSELASNFKQYGLWALVEPRIFCGRHFGAPIFKVCHGSDPRLVVANHLQKLRSVLLQRGEVTSVLKVKAIGFLLGDKASRLCEGLYRPLGLFVGSDLGHLSLHYRAGLSNDETLARGFVCVNRISMK